MSFLNRIGLGALDPYQRAGQVRQRRKEAATYRK